MKFDFDELFESKYALLADGSIRPTHYPEEPEPKDGGPWLRTQEINLRMFDDDADGDTIMLFDEEIEFRGQRACALCHSKVIALGQTEDELIELGRRLNEGKR